MAETNIVISVKPKYVAQILSGRKTVELRRRTVHVEPGSRVWIYTKAPAARIAAVATVMRVITGSPTDIWRRHRNNVGVSIEEFDQYFAGCRSACAILLCNVEAVAPAVQLADLKRQLTRFHPPQFFKRLRASELSLLSSIASEKRPVSVDLRRLRLKQR